MQVHDNNPNPYPLPTPKSWCENCKLQKDESQFYTDAKCPDHQNPVCLSCIQQSGIRNCPACGREYSGNEVYFLQFYLASLGNQLQ